MGPATRISVDGGALVISSAEAPYDQQLIFEYVERYAKRQGSVQLEFDGVQWTVSAAAQRPSHCSGCRAPLPLLTYAQEQWVFCPRCARTLCLLRRRPLRARGPARKPPRRTYTRPLSAAGGPPRSPRVGA